MTKSAYGRRFESVAAGVVAGQGARPSALPFLPTVQRILKFRMHCGLSFSNFVSLLNCSSGETKGGLCRV